MGNNQNKIPSKLFKLKEWLTVPEAAKHLSVMLGENVCESDVFRLAMDGHLILSVNFLNGTDVLEVEFLSPEENENAVRSRLTLYRISHYLNKKVQFSEAIKTIKGVFDIAPFGTGQAVIENEYQKTIGSPTGSVNEWEGIYLTKEKDKYFALQEKCLDQTNTSFPDVDPKDYRMAEDLPADCMFVVRIQTLDDLQENLSSKNSIEILDNREHTGSPFLNKGHLFYADELKIAVEAWTELYEINPPQHVPQGGHKKYIIKWLDENYPSLSDRARERITTIINPNPKGGASPTG